QLTTVVLTTVLASIGTAGVPGAGMIMLAMVLAAINLPVEGIALIAGIDRVLDMFRTSINIVGDASAAVVVAGSEDEIDRSTFEKKYIYLYIFMYTIKYLSRFVNKLS